MVPKNPRQCGSIPISLYQTVLVYQISLLLPSLYVPKTSNNVNQCNSYELKTLNTETASKSWNRKCERHTSDGLGIQLSIFVIHTHNICYNSVLKKQIIINDNWALYIIIYCHFKILVLLLLYWQTKLFHLSVPCASSQKKQYHLSLIAVL